MGMRKIVLLLASVFLAVLLASGAAVAVTPLGDTAEKIDADATTAARGPDTALDRALKKLVAMPGGPPGSSPWSSAARVGRSIPSGLPI